MQTAQPLRSTVISTWFVADSAADETFLPQVGTLSSATSAHAVYWRCIAVFFTSSVVMNPDARHMFFTNTDVPVVDGLDIAELFKRHNVEVVRLPITYRLPPGRVKAWGNQFYVFDVIRYFAQTEPGERYIILDSDCVWIKPVSAIEAAIDRNGALTYTLGDDEYLPDADINGITRAQMAAFLREHGGTELARVPYHGGEIYAATHATTEQIYERACALWPELLSGDNDAPREEAHLLSVIYAALGIPFETANPFIRRMWTTFQHNNLTTTDQALSIWHLPAEKKTGFAEAFGALVQAGPNADLARLRSLLTLGAYKSYFGFPRRRPTKLLADLTLKVREKLVR